MKNAGSTPMNFQVGSGTRRKRGRGGGPSRKASSEAAVFSGEIAAGGRSRADDTAPASSAPSNLNFFDAAAQRHERRKKLKPNAAPTAMAQASSILRDAVIPAKRLACLPALWALRMISANVLTRCRYLTARCMRQCLSRLGAAMLGWIGSRKACGRLCQGCR